MHIRLGDLTNSHCDPKYNHFEIGVFEFIGYYGLLLKQNMASVLKTSHSVQVPRRGQL